MKTVVKTDKAPGAIGPYSQGIDLGNMIFFSGQIPLNPQTGEMPEGIEAQAKQALENVKGLLESLHKTKSVRNGNKSCFREQEDYTNDQVTLWRYPKQCRQNPPLVSETKC